jgi:serine/threonine-protein kinase
MVQVEFRVRPYAFVYVDGHPLGQTPFTPVRISEGVHRVKLVNTALGKEVTVSVSIPARHDWVFRYNLGD